MSNSEIPAGTRAVQIAFVTERGKPSVTFDLLRPEYSRKTLAQLTSDALTAVIAAEAKYGTVQDYSTHFIG